MPTPADPQVLRGLSQLFFPKSRSFAKDSALLGKHRWFGAEYFLFCENICGFPETTATIFKTIIGFLEIPVVFGKAVEFLGIFKNFLETTVSFLEKLFYFANPLMVFGKKLFIFKFHNGFAKNKIISKNSRWFSSEKIFFHRIYFSFRKTKGVFEKSQEVLENLHRF